MAEAAPKRQKTDPGPPGCLMMGTGEYTTGFVGGEASKSDKSTGVVGIVCLDLKCVERAGARRGSSSVSATIGALAATFRKSFQPAGSLCTPPSLPAHHHSPRTGCLLHIHH